MGSVIGACSRLIPGGIPDPHYHTYMANVQRIKPPRSLDLNTAIELERNRIACSEWKDAPEEAQALCPIKSDDVNKAPIGIGYDPRYGYYVIKTDARTGPQILWPAQE